MGSSWQVCRSDPWRTYRRGRRAKAKTRERGKCPVIAPGQRASVSVTEKGENFPPTGVFSSPRFFDVGLLEGQHVVAQPVADRLGDVLDLGGQVVTAGLKQALALQPDDELLPQPSQLALAASLSAKLIRLALRDSHGLPACFGRSSR